MNDEISKIKKEVNAATNGNNFTDLATFITICGILLFQLGWLYWYNYFRVLNIDFSFIDLPIEKYIATTWYMLLAVFSCFLLTIIHILENKNNDFDILGITYVTICSCTGMTVYYFDENRYVVIILVIVSIIFIILLLISYKGLITFKRVERKIVLYIVVPIFYIICIFFYIYKGINDANLVLNNYKNDIEITFNNNSKARGKFVSFMNNKYFILIKNKKGKIETTVLNDNEIHHTRFIK